MLVRTTVLAASLILIAGTLGAQNDVPNAADPPSFPRIDGFYISSYRSGDPDVEAYRNGQGTARDTVEGRIVRMRYSRRGDAGGQPPTTLAIQNYYRDIVLRHGGAVIFTSQYGELTGRFVENGREYWVGVSKESLAEYNIVITDRPAPAGAPLANAASMPNAPRVSTPGVGPGRYTLLVPTEPLIHPRRGTRFSTVTIDGPGVEGTSAVRFGDWPAYILAASGGVLRVVVPEAPAGEHRVTLTTPSGAIVLSHPFTIYQLPITDPFAGQVHMSGCEREWLPEVQMRFQTDQATIGSLFNIEGTPGLPPVVFVSFTYLITDQQARQLEAIRDNRDFAQRLQDGHPVFSGLPEHRAFPVGRTWNTLTVRVPPGAVSGPIALYSPGGEHLMCHASNIPVNIRAAAGR